MLVDGNLRMLVLLEVTPWSASRCSSWMLKLSDEAKKTGTAEEVPATDEAQSKELAQPAGSRAVHSPADPPLTNAGPDSSNGADSPGA
ncbi:hypothetical protein ACSSS7_003874 [Eimeria intestinalis]